MKELFRWLRIRLGFPKAYYGVIPIYKRPNTTVTIPYTQPIYQGEKMTVYTEGNGIEEIEVA